MARPRTQEHERDQEPDCSDDNEDRAERVQRNAVDMRSDCPSRDGARGNDQNTDSDAHVIRLPVCEVMPALYPNHCADLRRPGDITSSLHPARPPLISRDAERKSHGAGPLSGPTCAAKAGGGAWRPDLGPVRPPAG